MPTYEITQAIRTLAITNLSFIDVQGRALIPINCDTVIIQNESGQDVLLRTDPANASSEVTLKTGEAYTFGGYSSPARSFRYLVDCPAVCSIKASTSPTSVLVESLQ